MEMSLTALLKSLEPYLHSAVIIIVCITETAAMFEGCSVMHLITSLTMTCKVATITPLKHSHKQRCILILLYHSYKSCESHL